MSKDALKLSPAKLAVLQAILAEEGLAADRIPRRSAGATPLSFAQERMWFLDEMEPGSAVYAIPFALRLRGVLDRDALERSLTEIVRRHESLRTTFRSEAGSPVAVVHLPRPVVLAVDDQAALEEEGRRPFDLATGPLFRARLLLLDEDEHVLVVSMHHIVSDGWSMGVFTRELVALYGAFTRGVASPLSELEVQYGDFAAWQRERLSGERLDAELAYWTERLRGAPALLELPTDRPRPAVRSHHGASHSFTLPAPLVAELRALGQQEGATLYMVLLAAWSVLLSRYSGQQDVVVGSPIAGRTRSEVEGLIGLFVNTLALRMDHSGRPTFRGVLKQARETTLGAFQHQDLPFEKLVEALAPERSLGHSPLFQVLFSLQNTPAAPAALRGLEVEPARVGSETTKFDLSLSMVERGDEIAAALQYATDLFDAETVERMAGHLRVLLDGIVADPERRVAELPLVGAAERARVVEEWNATATEYPSRCIHQLFEAQAARTPDAVALVSEGLTLTYSELDASANRLAHHLRGRGIGPESRVAVCLERGLDMVVALFGVLKAGGAYVPLDPDYPRDRLAHMLADSGAALLLTEDRLLDRLPAHPAVLCVDVERAAIAAESPAAPEIAVRPENLAYVIYTSGSTGTPKGAMNQHGGVVNRLLWMQDAYGLGASDVVLQKTPFSFDVSVWEFFWPLAAGARLVMARPGGHRDPAYLVETIQAESVTTLHFVPSMLEHFLAEPGVEACTTVRRVVCSGEALPPELRTRFFTHLQAELHNLYGPTEAAVDVSAWECTSRETGCVPIGRPIANAQLYVLDAELAPVPVGVPGELFIAGIQVGRGYLARPALTAEKFIPDPFTPGARMYRTGDRARWMANGALEYLGRVDFQVKLRGFRIELGEIEAALREQAGVREAVAVVRGGPADPRLVAYAVGESAESARLRDALRTRLPEYMVPAAVVVLDALPLSPNGKVDRKALPDPQWRAAEDGYVAPRDETEGVLCALWSELLGAARVGVHDDFFAMGGHSLMATRLVARVREALSVELPLRAFFEAPTPARLAAYAVSVRRAGSPAPLPPIAATVRGDAMPVSFAQERMWFLDRMEPGSSGYAIPLALRLRGRLDRDALERSLTEIVRRHEALRTTFRDADGRPVQEIHPPRPVALPAETVVDVAAALEAETARPFDLAEGPLFRAKLLRVSDDEHVLLACVHHIVSDGWSMGVFARELSALYGAFAQGEESPLGTPAVQYADYAAWQREHLRGARLDAHLAYWTERLRGAPALLELPTDHPRPAVQSHHGASHRFTIPAPLVAELRALGQREGATLYMVLLAAWSVLLSRHSGQDDVVIGSPIAGRTRSEVEGLIGLFINTLALRVELAGDPTFRELLKQVRETTLGAYQHQDLPFERLVDALAPERSLGHSAVFQVLFSLQNAPAETVRLEGLEVEPARVESETTKFDLALFAHEREGELALTLRYRTELFEAETPRRMLERFRLLLQGIAAGPERRTGDLPLMEAEELDRVLGGAVPVDDGAPLCIHELIAAQAARTPDAIALVCEERSLTYAELDREANRLANHLRGRGIGPESRVAVCLDRSADLVVALLATLKAGGAYVPLDPGYPRERIARMVAGSGAALLVARGAEWDADEGLGAGVVCLERNQDAIARTPETAPESGVRPENAAYVVYTSGSTGTPKGVVVEHRQLCAYVRGVVERLALPEGASFGMVSTIAADLGNTALYPTLCTGGALHLISQEQVVDPVALAERLRARPVDCLKIVPSHLAALLSAGHSEILPRLRLVLGGEPSSREWVEELRAAAPDCVVFNHYGPTETTVGVLTHRVGEDAARSRNVPLGLPLPMARAYVLDARQRPVPAGVPGELCVGGAQVARGYLGRPRLTAERFIPDPFAGEGARMYRTGDRVRRLPDGTLEFLGRTDDQVKLRGFRIEPGEIEAALRAHAREAVVMVREDAPGERRLVAYLVGQTVADGELRAHLRATLPEYMVPAAFVAIDALPLTSNGKTDRRALPAPEREAAREGYAAPRTAAEEVLCAVWAEVLGRERVGVDENFFELGGDSIQSIQVIARAARAGLRLTPRQLFQHQTIAELAPAASETATVRREQGPVAGPLTLTPIQRAFLERGIPRPHHYNQSMLLEVRGELDPAVVHTALARLLEHHDALRLRFVRTPRGWEGFHAPPTGTAAFERADLSVLPARLQVEALASVAAECQASLELAGGPVLRAILFDLGPERSARLLIVIHHLVVDGVSWRILVEDLETACRQIARGEPVSLPAKTTSFQHWAERLAAHAPQREDEAAFWLAQSESAPLPVDLGGEVGDAESARTVWSAFDTEETKALLQEVPQAYNTRIDDALLTALARTLTEWTGRDAVRVHLEGHGREDLFADVELTRTVGWFTTLYPVELPGVRGAEPGVALRTVKEQLRAVPGRGIGYGMLRHLTDGETARALRAIPAPQVVFNYLGSFDQTFSPASLFAPAREASGAARSGPRTHVLEVTGRVEGGCLRMGWSYSEEVHRRETIERLAARFTAHLRELIDHCRAPEAGGFTPSDFPAARVSTAELDKLFALMGSAQ